MDTARPATKAPVGGAALAAIPPATDGAAAHRQPSGGVAGQISTRALLVAVPMFLVVANLTSAAIFLSESGVAIVARVAGPAVEADRVVDNFAV